MIIRYERLEDREPEYVGKMVAYSVTLIFLAVLFSAFYFGGTA